MTTATLVKNVKKLTKEVASLRSMVFGIVGNDPEGTYRTSFVRHMKKIENDEPSYEFKNPKSFLKHIRSL